MAAATYRPRSLLIAACDGELLQLFVPLARLLRERGCEVHFFTPFTRERLHLRRLAERAWPPKLPPCAGEPSAELAEAIELRSRVGGIRALKALRRFAARVQRAAEQAVGAVDCALIWNGADLPAACVARAARIAGKPALFAENGLLPGSIQLDPQGVNHASAVAARIATAWRAQAPLELAAPGRGTGLPAPGPLWRAAVTLLEWIEAVWRPGHVRQSIGMRLGVLRRSRRALRPLPGDAAPLPERFLLVPLQVHDDTQILFHGGWVDSMETLLAAVEAAHGDLPVVVRQHPVDLKRTDYGPLERRYPGFLWTRRRDLGECLRRATAVLTVNSTVGIEALTAGRPVVVCGRAIFGVEPAVELAPDPEALGAAIRRAVARDAAPPQARQVLGYLDEHLHVSLDRRRPDGPALERLAARIAELCR